jgi:hypothetical protein
MFCYMRAPISEIVRAVRTLNHINVVLHERTQSATASPSTFLIYTGITRAKRLLVIVGQKKAMGLAVRNAQSRKRYSGLLNSLNGSGQSL